jgi:hypothetical protein
LPWQSVFFVYVFSATCGAAGAADKFLAQMLQGHEATGPPVVDFELKFEYRAPAWKLMGIDVRVGK